MKKLMKKMKGKKVLSMLLALIMVLAICSPAISPIMGLVAKAAAEFDVELAFDNLFVFDHWVTNGNSMIIDNDFGSVNAGTISDIDFENGSFRFNNNTNHNIYTRAAAGSGEKTQENFDYYRMPVEEGTTYTFSCNFTGTSPGFYPHVFYYTESNEFTGTFINGSFSGEGDHAFNFTVPAGAKYIQLRLAIAGNEAKNAYAVIKDIAISRYNFELDATNLFSLDSWVGSEKSDQPATSLVRYDDGKITPQDSNSDGSYDKLYFETNTDSTNGVGLLFTDFDYTSNVGYYSMDVKPNTDYTLSYNISGGNALHFSPYIVRYDANGKFIDFIGEKAVAYGVSNFTFTTTAETEYIAVVFSIEHQNQTWNLTVQDIGVYETHITDYTVDPVRKTYTYNSSNTATYGTLPTPPVETYPEGYIFAGWYTEKDGKGIRIAADTEILPQSMTVYPKFEPVVSSLTVKTPPTKTTYTVGEKINIAGLVLTATIDDGTGSEGGVNTFDISSGFYIDPEYAQDTAGTQTITAYYGGKTATFPITVSAGEDKNIVVNGNTHAVTVANNNYTINYQATAPFNRYEMTYYSDSYVKGEIVMDGVTEEFFLEPSSNGSFASYIDSFLRGVSHFNIDSIKFTCLDNEYGNFELLSLTTIAATIPSNPTQYYENIETGYKVGVDLSFGGVVSEIYDLNHTGIESRVYEIDGKNVTKVDYGNILDKQYGTNYISKKDENINLINKFDRGRYLQQSYYGTSQKPFEMGDYNGNPWPYNPVQGGNLVINNADGTTKGNEASKVIDYRITDDQIYVKTRPLDWGKNSEDYPDSYVTDSYMEAWYVFEDGMIKTYCRFVDFSGYPSHTRDQELPAVYIIEPLNHFVYNDVANGSQWKTTNYEKIEEPDFWGVLPEYNALLIADGKAAVDPTVDCYENWAAFAASDDADSFSVGVYSAGVTDFHYGCFYPKYDETEAKNGRLEATENRHAVTTDPATENPTSYISPVSSMTFESYKPIEYSYYLTTGNADEIYSDFKTVAQKDVDAELDKSKIAVPETAYMTPANGASKVGQYYVNNIMDENNNYSIKTEAVRDAGMYLGLHVKDAKEFSVKVTNVTDPSNDIYFCNTNGSEISESTRIPFEAAGTFENNTKYGLRFSGTGLQPGEKATAKWEITVYRNDGTSETYTAYTVMYAPERTVGAVAEARQNNNLQNELSSWITGANGVDHSQRAPLGSFHGDLHDSGYFLEDPLVTNYATPTITGSPENPHDYIHTDYPNTVDNKANNADDYSDTAYVLQTATLDSDSSRAQSYLGLLTVDKSRYTNTNQIPNLRIGYDALRVGQGSPEDSFDTYNTYYTLGTSESFTSTDLSATPSGWTTHESYSELNNSQQIPYRTSLTPAYSVSEIDGKYIHAIAYSKAYTFLVGTKYSTAGTSVLCSVTDKSGLRDAVLEGYTQTNTTPEFDEALKEAGTVLGDPSATQPEIDEAQKDLNNALENLVEKFYALKYDNLFSAYEFSQHPNSMTVVESRGTASYENGTITVKNDVITAGEAYTNYGSGNGYYLVDLKPNTEYVFEYDVETTLNAQAFMFFYNSSGGNGDVPTNMSIKTDNGNWNTKSESNTWWGNYTNGAGSKHYAIKFTTGANTTQASFRFGNTSNDPTTSTFSNIRLVESSKYYADATYSKTEDVYKEYASYGTMVTPVRTGYTFNGWKDAAGNTVTGADIATEHKSIYSDWTENKYTITYDANGGSDSIANQTVAYTENVNLASGGFTKADCTLLGWSTDPNATTAQYQLGQTVSKLNSDRNGTIMLYAVWQENKTINVTFDNLFDYSEFNIATGSLDIVEKTDTGFTIRSTSGTDANTGFSEVIPVEAGKTYIFSADASFKQVSGGYDMYIHTLDANKAGETTAAPDTSNGAHREGSVYISLTGQTNNANPYIRFTAGNNTAYIKIRFDANAVGNELTVNNIRVYEVGTVADGVSYEKSIDVKNGNAYGELPVPTRDGYTFKGWYDKDGNPITEKTVMNSSVTVNLFSKWEINNTALVADTVVVDFGLPTTAKPLDNDTVFNRDGSSRTLLGLSENGVDYLSDLTLDCGKLSLKDGVVTFTPTTILTGETTVYYHASATVDGQPVTLKNELTLAPASNVYYEETLISKGADTGKVPWEVSKGLSSTNAAENTGVYGYDNRYVSSAQFSNNTNYNVSVDSVNKRSETASFTFTGTGFDLVAACGANTGVQLVNIKQNGKLVKGYIVDTYYDTTEENPIVTGENLVYQTPIVNWTDDYGTYTVEITSYYLASSAALQKSSIKNNLIDTGLVMNSAQPKSSAGISEILEDAGISADDVELVWFDDNSVLNGGTGAAATRKSARALDDNGNLVLDNYIDGIRIYNTLNKDSSKYAAEEKNAVYANVVSSLVTSGDEMSGGIAYIYGNKDNFTWETYQKKGPKGEIYLFSDNAVTFQITVNPNEKVMLALRAVNGATKFNIGSTGSDTTITNVAINSATEMYYDITECIGTDDITQATPVTVTVKNSGDKLLAVNHIKFSGGDGTASNGGITPRSTTRSVAATAPVTADRFLPISAEDIVEAQNSLTKKAVDGIVKDGVVVPLVEEEIPGGDNNEGAEGETPEVPDDGGNEGGDDSSSTEDAFDIFSLLKWIIELIKKILFNTVGNAQLV